MSDTVEQKLQQLEDRVTKLEQKNPQQANQEFRRAFFKALRNVSDQLEQEH
ncbi:hypothetical protein JCM16358_22920 [Halanaerocella petrolearia]